MSRTLPRVLPPLLLLLVSLGVTAQTAAPRAAEFAEEIEVRVIDVDVVVTDRHGNPIPDLTRESFELYEDGRRVEIAYFSRIADGRIADLPSVPDADGETGASLPAASRTPLTWVVYIDQTNLPPQRRNQAMRQLQTFLTTAIEGGDRGVIAQNDGRSFKLRQGLTDDPKLLMDTLAKMEKERVTMGAATVRANQIRNEINRASTNAGDDKEWEYIAQNIANDIQHAIDEEAVRTRNAILSTNALLDALARVEGRLALVYVGAGFNTLPALSLSDAWKNKFTMLRQESYVPDPERHHQALEREISRLHSSMSAMRVTVYTIHGGDSGTGPTSVEDAGNLEPSAWESSGRAEATEAALAREMAQRTGGRFFKVNQQLAGQLAAVRRDLSNFYSLGYKPTGSPSDARRVKVKVSVEGARVRHRQTVRERTRQEKAAAGVVASMVQPQPRTAAKLQAQSGPAGRVADTTAANPLGVTVVAEKVRPDGWTRDFLLPFRFSINLEALTFLRKSNTRRAEFVIHFALVGRDGSVYPLESRDQALAIPESELPADPAMMVNYAWHVDLPPLKIPEDVPARQDGMRLTVTVEDRSSGVRSVITVPLGAKDAGARERT